MIGLASDKDNSYFLVQTPLDPKVAAAVDQRDVLSLSITEENEKMTEGSIRLLDTNDAYSKILRRNQRIIINWGYKNANIDVFNLSQDVPIGGAANLNLDQFGRQVDRRGLQAIIMNPSGEAAENGVKIYNATFLCYDQRGLDESKVYTNMTRGQVIVNVLTSLGVTPGNFDVGFLDDDKQLPDAGERQDETAFRYLVRKSQEWHAIFRIGYDQAGTLCGVFLSVDRLAGSFVVKRITGGSLTLRYGSGKDANVLSYRWQNNEGENGAGDNVRLQLVNGQYQYQRVTVQGEVVVVWQLDMDKVHAEMDRRSLVDQGAFVASVLDAKQFKDVQYLFRPVYQQTAPNGFGYTINAKTFGTPFSTPPAVATFAQGFPSAILQQQASLVGGAASAISISPRQNLFYVRKVVHDLSSSGWFCDMEIVDGYLLYGSVGLQ